MSDVPPLDHLPPSDYSLISAKDTVSSPPNTY